MQWIKDVAVGSQLARTAKADEGQGTIQEGIGTAVIVGDGTFARSAKDTGS
jgi:hypothetical protein